MRWALAVIVAVVAGMAGSLAGGLILSVSRNQMLMDIASAFIGILSGVYAGSRAAPSPGRAAKIFASIIIALALFTIAIVVLNPRAATEAGATLGQPLAQVIGAVSAFMLIRAHLGSEPNRLAMGVGGLLTVIGVVLVVGAGLYTILLTVTLYGAIWGPVGVIVVLILPPMWVVAPFVLWWISGAFPLVYFTAWLATWVGGTIAMSGSSLTAKPPRPQLDSSVQGAVGE